MEQPKSNISVPKHPVVSDSPVEEERKYTDHLPEDSPKELQTKPEEVNETNNEISNTPLGTKELSESQGFTKKEMPGIETRKRFTLQNSDPDRAQKAFEKLALDIDILRSTSFILKAQDGKLFYSFKKTNSYPFISKIPKTKLEYWPLDIARLDFQKLLKSPHGKEYNFELVYRDNTMSSSISKKDSKLPSTEFSEEAVEGEAESVGSLQDVVSFPAEPALPLSTFVKPPPKTTTYSYEEEFEQLKREMEVDFETWANLYKKYSFFQRNDKLLSALRIYKDVLLELEKELNSVWEGDRLHEKLREQRAQKYNKDVDELLAKRLNPITDVEEREAPEKKKKVEIAVIGGTGSGSSTGNNAGPENKNENNPLLSESSK